MAELLRNAEDFQVEDPYTKKMVRGMDPEVHIRRLQHFGEGAGIDLVKVHPRTSTKMLDYSEPGKYIRGRHPDPPDHVFDITATSAIHDEGTAVQTGVTEVADWVENLRKDVPISDRMSVASKFGAELDHRGGTVVQLHENYGIPRLQGFVTKNVNPIGLDEFKRNNADPFSISAHWRKDYPHPIHEYEEEYGPIFTGNNIIDALNNVQGRFKEINRSRGPLDDHIRRMVEHAIQNPNPRGLRRISRKSPHTLSSQFVKVTGLGGRRLSESNRSWVESPADVIDLSTGNWAKIDPEGYFPD